MRTTELITALANTLLVCGLCVAIAVPLGCLLALLLFRTDVYGRRSAWVMLGSQLAVPLYVFAGGWSAGVGVQGWLSAWAGTLPGLALEAGVGALLAVSAIHALAAIPWVCLICSLGLVWTQRSQEETAYVDGGLSYALRFSVLPKLRIWIAAGCLWCLLPVLTEMVVSNLYQVPTLAEQIYLDASRGGLSPATYLVGTLGCMLPLLLFGGLFLRRCPAWQAVVFNLAHHRAPPLALGRWRGLCSGLLWLIVLGLVALPMVNLLIKAGWQPWVDKAGKVHYAWQLGRLLTTLQESCVLFAAEFYWSGLLALSSTALALGLAIAGHSLARSNIARRVLVALMLILVAVPGPLVGMLTIHLLNRGQPVWLGRLYDQTLAAPVFAQQFRLLPLAWLLVATILDSISPRAWEQARMDGLRGVACVRRVILPQTWSLWGAACLLLAVTSVGELSSTILVLPPGVTTVSMRLFEMLHFGMRHQDSGLCCMLLLLGWSVSLVWWKTLRER
ncbi:MAG: ABC transporter permease subunit [Planctomycetales bacterium]|nr:ABC transporter permease subunit [Planctomycetales bacterium]